MSLRYIASTTLHSYGKFGQGQRWVKYQELGPREKF